MTEERTIYVERTPWPQWVDAIFLSAMALTCYPLLAGWGSDLTFPARAAIVVAIVAAMSTLKLLMGGMTVVVRQRSVVVQMGYVPVVRKVIPLGDILSLESVRYRPIRQFGGWGVRVSGSDRAWTVRGDQAVLVELREGRTIYIGSDHPRRLEERIRTAAAIVRKQGG